MLAVAELHPTASRVRFGHALLGAHRMLQARPVTEPTTDPLRELLDAANAGDRTALGQLLRRLGPQILRVARGVLGGAHTDVEDATQESLVAVASAIGSFRGESSVKHFACRIAARKCVTIRRRASARAERIGAIGRQSVPPPAEIAPSTRRQEALRKLLETISDEQSETMVLRFVLGLSLAECAEATGVPLNTVRSRLRLAKDALRRRIEADPALAETLEVGT